jgi:predicted lipoprotein with Yx(FWY)xxD motif
VYLPEKGGKVKCVGGCASVWPPLSLPAGGKPATTSPVHPTLIGTVANPSGGSIITYAGWPLHTYASDSTHGSYKGQGYGGQWYMISPSGTVIPKPVSSASSGSSSSGYGSGGTGY